MKYAVSLASLEKKNPVKTVCLEDRRALSPMLSFKNGFSLGVPELASKTRDVVYGAQLLRILEWGQ